MTCDTWFEKLKLESNTTLRFLTLCAGRDLISQNIGREGEGGVLYDFLGAYEIKLGFVWVKF